MQRFLSRERLFVAIAFLIGLAYALLTFGWQFFLSRGPYWDQPLGDMITHEIGRLYYIGDEWRFPLFYVPKFGVPEGSNIVFSDSIPALAFIAKIIYKLTGWSFHYFGFFIVTSFALVAAFTARTLQQTGVKDAFIILGGSMLAIANPALLLRGMHAGLMAHFLIVWAALIYILIRQQPKAWSNIFQFAVLMALTLGFQAYFSAMTLPFLVAALGQAALDRKLSPVSAIGRLGVVLASIMGCAWVFGLIGFGASPPNMLHNYGLHSMNLLSPFLPPKSNMPLFLAEHMQWDYERKTWDATGGQIEGYNYLGIGMIVLAAFYFVSRGEVANALRRHTVLCAMLLGLAVFALSNRVYLGNWLVLDVPISEGVDRIVGIFRTGGRMFWPIYYVLVIAAIFAASRKLTPKAARNLVGLAVLLQLVDTESIRSYAGRRISEGFPQSLQRSAWQPLLAAHNDLIQYPSLQCDFGAKQDQKNSKLELLLIAAQNGAATNSVYLGRPTTRDCSQESAQASQFTLKEGKLYVYFGEAVKQIEHAPGYKELCRRFALGVAQGVACTKDWSHVNGAAINANFFPITDSDFDPYDVGSRLVFEAGKNGLRYMRDGWSMISQDGSWSFQPNSSIALSIPQAMKSPLKVHLYADLWTDDLHPVSIFSVSANGAKLAELNYVDNEGAKTYDFEIPAEVVKHSAGRLKIEFNWVPPIDQEQATLRSDRRMGIMLRNMLIFAPIGQN
jgi:Family of unknown function (DUF6311)